MLMCGKGGRDGNLPWLIIDTEQGTRYRERGSEGPLVDKEALVRLISPGSTLEPGLKVFHRRGH
jgi:hypothetical protein